MELSIELVSMGLPGSRTRAEVVAGALIREGFMCVAVRPPLCSVRLLHLCACQELRGAAYTLPLLQGMRVVSCAELKWLVELSIRISKSPLQLSTPLVGDKRKADTVTNITALSKEVLARLKLPTDMGLAVRGPAKAIKAMPTMNMSECTEWLVNARVSAIAGSCPRSSKEIASSVRAYTAFAAKLRQLALPPTVDMLLAWSNLFRSSRTFANYVSLLRTACQIAGIYTAGMHDPALKKAMRAIDKRRGYTPREPMFIQFELVQKLVHQASKDTNPAAKTLSMAFLMSYVFLLRLPSECLPVCTAADPANDSKHKAVVAVHSDRITLRLSRRKNKEGGSFLTRKCWCATCKATCPVHALGKFFASLEPGCSPFSSLSAYKALTGLRIQLQNAGVPEALKYRTHDLRRGHAKDLAQSGSSLLEILKAGEWRSAAFLQYMDVGQLECDATTDAHLTSDADMVQLECDATTDAHLTLDAHLEESSDEDCERC